MTINEKLESFKKIAINSANKKSQKMAFFYVIKCLFLLINSCLYFIIIVWGKVNKIHL